MELVSVTDRQQDSGLTPFCHVSCPIPDDRDVVPEVPPEVVGQLLRAAVELPASFHRE